MNNDDFMKRILTKLDTMDEKIDKVSDKTSRIDVTLQVQHVTLEEHTRRSTTLEEEFKPIRASVLQIQGGIKLLAIIGTVVAIMVGLDKFFN